MRICTKCNLSREDGDFNKKSGRKDGLNSHCKFCSRLAGKKAYNKKRSYYIEKARKVKNNLIEMVRKIKEEKSCMDCNKKYPHYVMDFDHRDSDDKEFCIANLSGRKKLIAEIEKCDLVCSNCHRIRTYNRLHPW